MLSCIPSLYSEKNDEKYRCSETGYRIPFKCVEIRAGSKDADCQKTHKSQSALENTHDNAKTHVMLHDAEELTISIRQRHLLDDSSTLEGGSQTYITYRSCIVNEEKLSILGFKGIILCLLLVSGVSVVYFRRKQMGAISGVGTNNSRF